MEQESFSSWVSLWDILTIRNSDRLSFSFLEVSLSFNLDMWLIQSDIELFHYISKEVGNKCQSEQSGVYSVI